MGDEISALRRKYEGPPPGTPRGPLQRRNDPGTSAIAAQKIRHKIGEAETLILGVLAHQGHPITSCQIAERLTFKVCRGEARPYDWWRFEVARRMRGLERMGQVMQHPKVKCPVAGSLQVTWSRDPRRDRKLQHWTERD